MLRKCKGRERKSYPMRSKDAQVVVITLSITISQSQRREPSSCQSASGSPHTHTHTQALLRTFYPPQAGLRPGHSSALTGSPAQDPGKRGKNGNSKPRKNSLGPTIISIGGKEEGGAGGDGEEWAPCSKCFRKAFGRELPLEPVSGILTVLLPWLLSHHAGGKGLSSGLPE